MALFCTPPANDRDGAAHIVQVAVGKEHGLFLTDEGQVYSWGTSSSTDKQMAQLGRSAQGLQAQEPAKVGDKLRDKLVVQIACGAEHCMVLTKEGELFVWGNNTAGQLGVGWTPTKGVKRDKEQTAVSRPRQVTIKENMPVRSISCAPESSACVLENGEVYIWGAISHFMFNEGSRYGPGENICVPVRVRGTPPHDFKDRKLVADQVAVCRDQLACTIAPSSLEDHLQNYITSLRRRSAQLIALTRAPDRGMMGSTGSGVHPADRLNIPKSAVQHLNEEFVEEIRKLEREINEKDSDRKQLESELKSIARGVTICDQQEQALNDDASALEIKRNELTGDANAARRALDSQLNDNRHFKESNKTMKLQLLKQREEKELKLLALMQKLSDLKQQKGEFDARTRLLDNLQRGQLGNASGTSSDDVLTVVDGKRMELEATHPQVLSGAGQFCGMREVIGISNHALHDIYGALREVSSTSGGVDNLAIEEVLESNFKLRKEVNGLIEDALKEACNMIEKKDGFFEEACNKKAQKDNPLNRNQGGDRGGNSLFGGFFGGFG
eukprot:CAMPEP_0176058502 /NCGR_PEP_ID=MMETSP0120_2-20121206/29148_1 /TAXON_ID=160619 /ORGANISM="Kryptoperidinium foliaceum, Strain CCMP 1326" /LENGTH=554 /DNA_ID=CAMNT_0017392029 /DNA_START=26 /DNA_END=1693 /DNA_ORIENTATION=-